jgi:transposase
VRTGRVWARLLDLGAAVVEEVNFGDGGEVVVAARARWHQQDRCGVCRRRSPGFDLGEGRRRWRALDLGATLAYVEAEAPRVRCREHGVVVCAVPWARHGSRFTRSFEDQAAWLTVQCSRKAVAELLRIAWRTVGSICERVAAEAGRDVDLLAGLRWIGIDEISHRKGQRYLTIVVDHHTGRLVWAASGRDRKSVEAFLDALGPERCEQIELVSADMASWISGPIAERCPDAVRCVDPFHVVQLATDALDEIRREVWNEARKAGQTAVARGLKGARFALGRTPSTSPAASAPSSRPSSRPTSASTGATCSKSSYARSTASRPSTPARCWTPGFSGRAAAACSRSSSSPARSPNSAPESKPRSSTGSPTPASKPSTPRSA